MDSALLNRPAMPPPPPVIRTIGLTKRYGARLALDSLDLIIQPGRITGFLGPNGAGKSTTIGLLLGLIYPNAGRIELFGQPVNRARGSLHRRIGTMLESAALYPYLTVAEHLQAQARLGRFDHHQIPTLLEQVDLTSHAQQPARMLSLGQRQRLGLALALLGEPELLILDEPTNGLDPAGLRSLYALLQRFTRRGGSIFLSSHRLSEVQELCEEVVILHQGRLVAQGPVAELLRATAGVLQVRVDQPHQALRLLTEAGWLVSLAGGIDDTYLTVQAPADRAAEVNALLITAGIGVTELRADRPALETLFHQLTGAHHDHA